jgi:hypothetical protein
MKSNDECGMMNDEWQKKARSQESEEKREHGGTLTGMLSF